LFATDVVYAAGSPKLVQAVGQAAARARAAFFADAFVASGSPDESWLLGQLGKISLGPVKQRLRTWIGAVGSSRQLGMKIGVVERVKVGCGRHPGNRSFWRNVA